MVHDPFIFSMGGSDDLRKDADTLDKMKAGIVTMYQAKTGMSPQDLAGMMTEETWMTADEALENGFIDAIRTDDESILAKHANFDLSKFRNSANFALRLQKRSDPDKELSGGKGGNTSASVKLSDLEEATGHKPTNAATPDHLTTLPKEKPKMTPEETAAQANEVKRLAKEQAKQLVAAQNKFHGELDAAVELVKTRDKRDFTPAAKKVKEMEEGTMDDFYRLVATSNDFKPVDIVGAGEEHVEVVTEFRGRNVIKGSPGEQFVNSDSYKHARDAVMRGGKQMNARARTKVFNDAFRAAGLIGAPIEQDSSEGPIVTGFRNAVSDSGLVSQQDVPGVFQLGVRQLKVKDVLMGGVTNRNQIRYIKETAFANGATTVAEGAAKPYGTVTVTQTTAPVQKIAALIKVTDELWSDFPRRCLAH